MRREQPTGFPVQAPRAARVPIGKSRHHRGSGVGRYCGSVLEPWREQSTMPAFGTSSPGGMKAAPDQCAVLDAPSLIAVWLLDHVSEFAAAICAAIVMSSKSGSPFWAPLYDGVALSLTPGIRVVAEGATGRLGAARKLDVVYCAGLTVGAPRVSLAGLCALHELLLACESRQLSADGNILTPETHDGIAASGRTKCGAAPSLERKPPRHHHGNSTSFSTTCDCGARHRRSAKPLSDHWYVCFSRQ